MIRLMTTYGSIKSSQDINEVLLYGQPSLNDLSVDEYRRGEFFRWFPQFFKRFTCNATTGMYEPTSGHVAELKYREEMKSLDASQQNNNNSQRSATDPTSVASASQQQPVEQQQSAAQLQNTNTTLQSTAAANVKGYVICYGTVYNPVLSY